LRALEALRDQRRLDVRQEKRGRNKQVTEVYYARSATMREVA
jgi:hypothetical protein